MENKLNFGCGDKIISDFVNVDIRKGKGIDRSFDFDKFPYPFKDNTFEFINADNVIEHLDNLEKVFLELHRVSKDGAVLYCKVPYYNHVCTHNSVQHRHHFNERTFFSLTELLDGKFEIINQKIIGGVFWRWIPQWLRVSLGHYISNINSGIEVLMRVKKQK